MTMPLNSEGVCEFNGLEYRAFALSQKPLPTILQNTWLFNDLSHQKFMLWYECDKQK
jgi:hypothetical protein